MVGQTLSHYRILELLGRGGMGVVYRARDERLERDVAIKLISPDVDFDDDARRRLHREAVLLSRLSHPNIGTVYELDTHDGTDFLVMELVPGETLERRLSRGPLPESETIEIAIQVAEALEEAHERGVVHRDLKPGNVMVTDRGRIKVLDFGLARPFALDTSALTATLTQPVAGTLPYMAPELLQGNPASVRSDLYAFGVMLYEMITGALPYPRQDLATLGTPPSEALSQIVNACLEADPARRPANVAAVLSKLRTLAVPAGREAGPGASSGVADVKSRRAMVIVIAGALILLLVGVLYRLDVGGLRSRWMPPASRRIESLAVLPLQNLTGDPAQEYVADGMTDELITHLAHLNSPRVISRTSVMRFKGSHQPLPEIARMLNVEAVVEGSLIRSGDHVRITAQLVEAATDRNLWAESYEGSASELLALEGRCARAIASQVHAELAGKEREPAVRRVVNPKAYDAYLLGRFFWAKRTPDGLRESVARFQEAIALDSTYAPAYAGLADAHLLLGTHYLAPPERAGRLAIAAAEKALALDPNLGSAYAALGFAKLFDEWDWAGAGRAFDRAVALAPGDATAHHWRASWLRIMGREREALEEIRRAVTLDPLALQTRAALGFQLYLSRRYDEAAATLRETLAMDATFGMAHGNLSTVYMVQGRLDEALNERRAELETQGLRALSLPLLAQIYARRGDRPGALAALREVDTLSTPVPFQETALAWDLLGDRDRAFECFDRAFRAHTTGLVWLRRDPRYDPLRGDPRFAELVRKVGMP